MSPQPEQKPGRSKTRDGNERILQALDDLKVSECWCDTGDGNPHSQQCLNAQRLRRLTVEMMDRDDADENER